MLENNVPFPDRPDGWKHDYTPYLNITGYDGTILAPVTRPVDYGKMWEKHKSLLEAEATLRAGSDVRGINTRAVNSYEENKLWEEER